MTGLSPTLAQGSMHGRWRRPEQPMTFCCWLPPNSPLSLTVTRHSRRFGRFGPTMRVGCVVNMAESAEEAGGIHEGLLDLSRAFLGAEIDNLGYIPFNRVCRTCSAT
jgi:hypothetical protein